MFELFGKVGRRVRDLIFCNGFYKSVLNLIGCMSRDKVLGIFLSEYFGIVRWRRIRKRMVCQRVEYLCVKIEKKN